MEQVHDFTNIDPWFLAQLSELHQAENWMSTQSLTDLRPEDFLQLKKRGFSDIQIARCTGPAWLAADLTHCIVAVACRHAHISPTGLLAPCPVCSWASVVSHGRHSFHSTWGEGMHLGRGDARPWMDVV